MKTSEEPVIVEETYSKSPDSVWRAITEVDQMRKWYFDNIPNFQAEVGFKTEFNVQSDGRDFLHQWEVTEVAPGKMISYGWKYQGYPGDALVTFELSKVGDGAKLKLTCLIKEDFPDEIPEFTRESCLGGWTYFINQSLKAFLE